MYYSEFRPSKYAGDILPALDPDTIPKNLRHRTTIEGTFNGKAFRLVGGGKGQPHEGILDCRLESRTGPVPFSMPMMNVIAIFGYPTYSKHVNVFDIFKRSDGYEYERNILFQDGGSMQSLHVVRYGEMDNLRVLDGHFTVTAEANLPTDIIRLDPILETFIPAGPGRVRSKFVLSWVRRSGEHVLASCESEYRLRHDITMPKTVFRSAEFVEDRSTPEVLDLDERIWVSARLAAPMEDAA